MLSGTLSRMPWYVWLISPGSHEPKVIQSEDLPASIPAEKRKRSIGSVNDIKGSIPHRDGLTSEPDSKQQFMGKEDTRVSLTPSPCPSPAITDFEPCALIRDRERRYSIVIYAGKRSVSIT